MYDSPKEDYGSFGGSPPFKVAGKAAGSKRGRRAESFISPHQSLKRRKYPVSRHIFVTLKKVTFFLHAFPAASYGTWTDYLAACSIGFPSLGEVAFQGKNSQSRNLHRRGNVHGSGIGTDECPAMTDNGCKLFQGCSS